ncbi:hypothetical protein G6F56_000108 [Rhizopus delemar]|uniref:Glutamine amidotransferase type-2 domain-containing protein n=1 Tax=Rhizopus stolonifer TaxID=4846 RepID=A0A367KRZ0_RHIST|nr:hypothetical protein G6F56_000108 [Rhizopus delemar]RCI04907.1 hypothetical protein CU098_012713 [Rhizopus stolonifer]
MCGFSAYFLFDSSVDQFLPFNLNASLEQIRHRGPDADGKYISNCGRCGLGHVRLSINDLEGGHQPISDETESVFTVVNGELYDFERIKKEFESKGYVFKTRSDSEIILPLYQEYGLSFLEHLRGEFAFCMHDTKRNRFIAVRDRFGIKPAYYTVQNGALLVASEIKAFLPMGWKPEWDIDSIVHNGPLMDYRTCFKNVYKIPPAHYLMADPSGFMELRPYWSPDYPDKSVLDTRSVDEMIEGVHDRLENAVRLRLRADVPVGVYLSGGIDSSCIAAIASKVLKEKDPNARLKSFSISFKDGKAFDESEVAERTSKFIDADFEKIELTEDDLLANFEECVWHSETPLVNLNSVGKFMLSKTVRNRGYRTVMTGEGSDEHFGGYLYFSRDYLLEPDHNVSNDFDTTSEEERRKLVRTISNRIKTYAPIHYQAVSPSSNTTCKGRCHNMIGNIHTMSDKMFTNEVIRTHGPPNISRTIFEAVDGMAREKANKKWHPLHSSLYFLGRTFLGNLLCGYLGDRSEMAHSVEGRTPFLDHPLCEYVNGLPPSVKIKIEQDGSLNEKWILKQAMKPYVTEEIYKRTKQSFLAPPSKGKSEMVVELMNRLITKENINRLGWANFNTINAAKEKFLKTGEHALFSNMVIIMSYVVLSERFGVYACHFKSQVAR